MKNKLFLIVSCIISNSTLLSRIEHSVILSSIKQLRTADEMIMDLAVKKTDTHEETIQPPFNAYEIKQSHFLQAVKIFNTALTDLTKNVEGITTEDDHEIRRKGEHFIANGARALESLAGKVDRRDLALALKSGIKEYKEYAKIFAESRVNTLDEEADVVFEEDGAEALTKQFLLLHTY
jgi:hypothetical protein